jgi:hypothetical protein
MGEMTLQRGGWTLQLGCARAVLWMIHNRDRVARFGVKNDLDVVATSLAAEVNKCRLYDTGLVVRTRRSPEGVPPIECPDVLSRLLDKLFVCHGQPLNHMITVEAKTVFAI